MNKIMIIGNLGRDPEMNYTPNGVAKTTFSVAVSRNTKQADGERSTETEWFNVVAWRQLAETCASFLTKGKKVLIEGRLTTRKYTDKNNVERTIVEIVASDIEFLSPRDNREEKNSEASAVPEDSSEYTPF